MISNLSLSDAMALDQQYEETDPYAELGRIEAELPLGLFGQSAPSVPLSGDASARLKPKGGGKKVEVQDYSPAIRKMLERNKNRSQQGMNWRDEVADDMVRSFYADHSDIG
jgi:hypothetical protein